MPKNVMKLLKPSPHRARNDFDLSHRHIMSANFGELIPSTCIETVPGDHIEMHASDLLRAIPMVTSPFLRAKQHLDVWFVPYQDLWHQFNNFITKKAQPVSSAMLSFDYCPWVSIFDLYDSGCNASSVDIVGRRQDIGARRLLNYLGYAGSKVGNSNSANASVNPFRLAAYNYIWYNEYRQQYYDNGTALLPVGSNPADLFNFDALPCNTLSDAELNSGNLEAMCQMRYRTWKKDLFTGLLPSTQYGNVSTISSTSYVQAVNGNIAVGSVNMSINSSNDLVGTDSQPVSTTFSVSPSVDVLSLRRSEAIQIWRENALRAGNRVKDNMRAHYGVDSDFRDHRPTYLGSVDAPLNIGDVMATANSTFTGDTNPNTNVGDVAGKGLSSLDEKVFKFDAKDFGVIMVMFSILPEAEYNAYGISRPNQLLEAEDFFTPEFENLGLESVSSLTFETTTTNNATVMGYAPRYFAYKTKLDKCYDFFRTSNINATWCSPKYDVTTLLGSPTYQLPLSVLYVNPKIFDVNFSVSVDNAPQFLCDFYFDVDAVRPMSVIGLPFS